jgi:LuxR family maltose regulon positive regulatory protein
MPECWQHLGSLMFHCLLHGHIAAVFKRGEFSTLLYWFDSFPPEVERSTEMSLLYAFILIVTGQPARAELELQLIEQRYQAEKSWEARKQIQSGVLFLQSNLLFFSGHYEQWHKFAEGIGDEMLPENQIFYNFNYNMTEPLVRQTALGLKGVLSPETEMVGLQFNHVLESHGWHDSLINLYVRQS